MQKIEKTGIAEIITAVILMALLVVFVHPPGLLMPKSMQMIGLALFIIAYFVFLGFFWKEKARDERDYAHQLTAGRVSFFVGSAAVSVGIVVQALRHDIDPWLVGALGLMILAKILTRMYKQFTS